jgi:hypothetical protein
MLKVILKLKGNSIPPNGGVQFILNAIYICKGLYLVEELFMVPTQRLLYAGGKGKGAWLQIDGGRLYLIQALGPDKDIELTVVMS